MQKEKGGLVFLMQLLLILSFQFSRVLKSLRTAARPGLECPGAGAEVGTGRFGRRCSQDHGTLFWGEAGDGYERSPHHFQCGSVRLCVVLWQVWDRAGRGCSAVTLPPPRVASTAGGEKGKKGTKKQVQEAVVGTEGVTLQKTPQVTSRNELSLFIIK